ncbi:hypothetical protein BaRGS_00040297, partial [Batillaria attramentaria]
LTHEPLYRSSDKLTVVYFNSQSCRTKTDEIRDLVADERIHIAFITESWLVEHDHKAIFCDLVTAKPMRAKRAVTSRDLNKINVDRFKTDVKDSVSRMCNISSECSLLTDYN